MVTTIQTWKHASTNRPTTTTTTTKTTTKKKQNSNNVNNNNNNNNKLKENHSTIDYGARTCNSGL